jgi:hypothetical protein
MRFSCPDTCDDGRVDDLTAFLKARLKELESAALESKNAPPGAMRYLDADQWTLALSWEADADLVLRRVKAVRAIVERYERGVSGELPEWKAGRELLEAGLAILLGVLRDLAAVWSDHPGYRPEWKP